MIRSILLLPAVSALGVTGVVNAQADTAISVRVLDNARLGQQRYLQQLLERSHPGGFVEEEDCRGGDRIDAGEACVRSPYRPRPTAPVLILGDQPRRDPERPGSAILVCVGGGTAASNPAAQRISLWPTAARLKGATAYIRDSEALAGCIAAARAERAGD